MKAFVVTNDHYIARRNFFIYADGAASTYGAKQADIVKNELVALVYQFLFWVREA